MSLSEPAIARRELLRLGLGAGLGIAAPRFAWALDAAEPAMPNLTALLDEWTGPGKFPGILASLGLPGRPAHYVARGTDGFTDFDPMGPDSLYRIYSMTKPITGMAAMMLIGDGKMTLDQPLGDILPKYARMQVQVTPDGSITDLRPAKAAITIRHLLTHTAGLGYSLVQTGPLKKAMEDAGVVAGQISRIPIPGLDRGKAAPSLELFADRLAALPLVYDPGTVWSYSLGLDLMGRVIEVVSGKSFDNFLQERMFGPCGMTSTFFQVPQTEARRLVTSYGVFNGLFVPVDPGDTSIFLDPPPFPTGGSGLVSSPRDYDRFLQMLAGFGMVGGTRVMSEAAVRLGTGNLLPPAIKTVDLYGIPGHFGAGGRLGIGAEDGIFGWSGAAGTVATVDMKRGIRAQLFPQFMPPNATTLLAEYQKALQADVMLMTNQTGNQP